MRFILENSGWDLDHVTITLEAMPTLYRREIEKSIRAHAAPDAARAVKVVLAKFRDHAGTVGAAKLALDMQSDDPPIDLE